jgi:hypothetical protein
VLAVPLLVLAVLLLELVVPLMVLVVPLMVLVVPLLELLVLVWLYQTDWPQMVYQCPRSSLLGSH